MKKPSKKIPIIILQRFKIIFRPNGPVFYGWWIVAVASFVMYLGSLFWVQSYGAYAVIFNREFGWSMTMLAAAYTLTRIESGLLGPFQGWLTDRYGPRLVISIGLLMYGIGLLCLTLVKTIQIYFLAVVIISIGISLGGYQTLMVAIVNWFQQHRTKAIALTQLGHSLGGLSVPILAYGLEEFGWRTIALTSGFASIFLGIPLVQHIRHRPEEKNEVVDGKIIGENYNDRLEIKSDIVSASWQNALRTRSFWFISVGHAIALLSVSAVLVHLIPHLTNTLRMELTEAGLVFSTVSISQIIGLSCGGYLGDRFSKRIICSYCMIFHGSGMLVLAFFDDYIMVLLFSVLHGIAWGIRGPQMVAIRADYFGTRSFGKIFGISSMVVMFGTMLGPLISGLVVDHYGIYRNAFISFGLISFLGAVLFFFSQKPNFTAQKIQKINST